MTASAPSNRGRRPADVGCPLDPSYLPPPGSAPPQSYLAIDVVTSNPSASRSALPIADSAASALRLAELDKFRGSDRINGAGVSSPASGVSQDLLSHNILLLPFAVDSFGGVGPLAHRFLCGAPSSLPSPPRIPPFSPDLFPPSNPLGVQVSDIAHGPSGVRSLFGRSNRLWSTLSPSGNFGNSYHSTYPGRWAAQTLGLNIAVGTATYCRSCISKCLNHSSKRPPSVRGPVFRRPPPSLLFPGAPPSYLRVPCAVD